MAETKKRKAESGFAHNDRNRLMIGTMRLPTFAEREHDYTHFLQRLADQASEAEMLHLKKQRRLSRRTQHPDLLSF